MVRRNATGNLQIEAQPKALSNSISACALKNDLGLLEPFSVFLKTPNQALFRTGLGGEKGGVALGRLQGLYGGANSDKFTIFSIVNNSDQSIVRIVKGADGADGLYLNARIVGTKNMLRHEPITNYKKVIKGLFELAQHGWKQ